MLSYVVATRFEIHLHDMLLAAGHFFNVSRHLL